MTHATIRIILEEHVALTSMLNSVLLMLERQRRQATAPDFATLRAMLFYIDEFPEKRHHRKESQLLFPKLRARSPLWRDLFDKLEEDHALGEQRIRHLEHALLAYEMMGESRREAFEKAVRAYASFYIEHMALEESKVLPMAERVLTEQDWADLDEAFGANRDPLTGREPDEQYRRLFRRIAAAAAMPIGLGAPRPRPVRHC
jgi:hemerythrin-like domain-containing protein